MTINEAAAIMGRKGGAKGGKSRSKAKQAASRRNGRKGGRKPLDKARAKARENLRRAKQSQGYQKVADNETLGRRGIGPAGDPPAASNVTAHETPRRPKQISEKE